LVWLHFLIAEGLGKKANSTGRKCLRPGSHFRKGGNENDRQPIALHNQFTLQLDAIHAWRLHVADQTISVMQAIRFQECFSGCKLERCVSKGANEARRRAAKRIVIIDNCDYRRIGLHHSIYRNCDL
jgi:hypothetical protein